MGLFKYKCSKCGFEELFFGRETLVCSKCSCEQLDKLFSVPLTTKNMERVDKYHNVQNLPGIKEDVKRRNRKHTNDNIKETIDEFGKKVAIEQGWIDPHTKKARNNWDDK